MRIDKAKKVSSVTKELLENPLQTVREVAEKTGVSKSSVASYIQEDLDKLGLKDDRILWLTDKDFELMKQIQEVKFKRLQEDEQINNNDLDKWENTAVKRYSLFRWSATDKDGGLKQIDNIDIL